MNKYDVIVEALQEMIDDDKITLEDAEIINEMAYDKYVSEGIKDTLNKAKSTAAECITKTGEGYVSAANKRAEFVAKKVIRKPNMNNVSLVDAYNRKINKVKSAYKVGEMLATQAVVAFIPIPTTSTLFNAALVTGYKNSNDPSDKKVANIINTAETSIKNVLSKIKSLFTKNTGKVVTPEFDKEVKKLESEGLNIAKNADSKINNIKNNTNEVATESVADFELLKIECELFEDPFDAINRFIMESTYDVDTFEKVQELIESI